MAGGYLSFFDPFKERFIERQKPDGVCHGRTVLARASGHFILRQVKLIDQSLKCARLLDGVQIFALNVLNKRQLESLFITYIPQHCRHTEKLRALGRAPSAFTGDELVSRPGFSHN